ncbi:acetylcholinesterase-like [Oratosquilla oratoria]|uniref:acetylcholinesterase-like n=1 Tax=Oratosquilla oratoria TaxID=337810 RepID=UPI003F75B217
MPRYYFNCPLVMTCARFLALAAFVLSVGVASESPNSLINSSTLEVNEPRSEDKGEKVKHSRPHDPLVVQTRNGLIKGFQRRVMGKNINIFYGIPFAKPPVDELRFKKPVPIDPWVGVLEATKLPNSCVQQPYEYFPGFRGEEMWNPNTALSEDCLYLSIWTPASLMEANRPPSEVLVWIYGGGYMGGTNTLDVYDASYLTGSTEQVVVSMQYRVGAFGYLYLNMDEAPGNMGMYDQALAIKWIRDNIEYFGGNPERITLFGESAGAGSVSLHLLSPVSRHLFDRAILQSGVVNCPWSVMTAERAYEIGLTLVDDCGCNSTRLSEAPEEVMDCMRDVDAANISIQQWNSYTGILQFPSAPTIEGVFLPDDPIEMLKRGDFKKTEILIGSNQDEGTYFILYDFIKYFEKDEAIYLERDKFLEIINEIFKGWSPLEKEAIIFQYTDWEHIDDGHLNQKMIGDVVGDYYFICPSNYFAQMYAEWGSKVYYYFFTHRTSINPWGSWMGVMHADEIDYVFGHPLNRSSNYSEAEVKLSKRMMAYYATFARTGRPVEDDIKWPIYSHNQPQYFVWNGHKRGLGKGPRATACAFWNELMPVLREQQASGHCKREMQKALNGVTPSATGSLSSPIVLLAILCILYSQITAAVSLSSSTHHLRLPVLTP